MRSSKCNIRDADTLVLCNNNNNKNNIHLISPPKKNPAFGHIRPFPALFGPIRA